MKSNYAGLAVGCIGGCVSILGMALYYTHAESAIATIGVLLLLGAMFFGAAGGFSKYGPWTPKALTVYTFLVVPVAAVATLGEIFEVLFGAVEIVLAIILAVLAYIQIPNEN
ncbi:MAG: hypothetical protein IJ810_03320 [Candidatus Methanomethylophilus sp.]|nr:hypothetical protein [Methanomethylophilus sp.]